MQTWLYATLVEDLLIVIAYCVIGNEALFDGCSIISQIMQTI